MLAMSLAIEAAQEFEGATSPNPPVGAALVKSGIILGVAAHEIAGAKHAEASVIEKVLQSSGSEAIRGSTLYVTLEPCNHTGRTPPCVQAIIASGIQKVIIGARDPNPRVTGRGYETLVEKNIAVEMAPLWIQQKCKDLIAPFTKYSLRGLPLVVHKLAFRLEENGNYTMIPPQGSRKSTFTDEHSLRRAHLERRRSDALLTGMGTVLTDLPQFTVRHVPDHPQKKREIVVIADSKRAECASQKWLQWKKRQESLGFHVSIEPDIFHALSSLGNRGVLRVLLEAGPRLSSLAQNQDLCDKRLVFLSRPGLTDLVIEEDIIPQDREN